MSAPTLSAIAQAQVASDDWTLVGVLVIGISALAGVIIFLVNHIIKMYREEKIETKAKSEAYATAMAAKDASIMKCREENAVDRAKCATELEEARAENEERLRESIERYTEDLKAERDASRVREDAIHRDYQARLHSVTVEVAKTMQDIAPVLDKLSERRPPPRRPGG